jgi:hypothetical protein
LILSVTALNLHGTHTCFSFSAGENFSSAREQEKERNKRDKGEKREGKRRCIRIF